MKQPRKGALGESASCLHLCRGPATGPAGLFWLDDGDWLWDAGETLEWKELSGHREEEPQVAEGMSLVSDRTRKQLVLLWLLRCPPAPSSDSSAQSGEALQAGLRTQGTFSLVSFGVSCDVEIAFPLICREVSVTSSEVCPCHPVTAERKTLV